LVVGICSRENKLVTAVGNCSPNATFCQPKKVLIVTTIGSTVRQAGVFFWCLVTVLQALFSEHSPAELLQPTIILESISHHTGINVWQSISNWRKHDARPLAAISALGFFQCSDSSTAH